MPAVWICGMVAARGAGRLLRSKAIGRSIRLQVGRELSIYQTRRAGGRGDVAVRPSPFPPLARQPSWVPPAGRRARRSCEPATPSFLLVSTCRCAVAAHVTLQFPGQPKRTVEYGFD
jgi:hypothetical protein